MVVAVLVLEVVAIGAHRLLGIEARPRNVKLAFTAAWMLATLAIVLPSMQRIRTARLRARRTRLG
jgi:hypothetical protein